MTIKKGFHQYNNHIPYLYTFDHSPGSLQHWTVLEVHAVVDTLARRIRVRKASHSVFFLVGDGLLESFELYM